MSGCILSSKHSREEPGSATHSSAVTNGSGISAQSTRGNVESGFTTDEHTIPTDNGIGGEGGTLEEGRSKR